MFSWNEPLHHLDWQWLFSLDKKDGVPSVRFAHAVFSHLRLVRRCYESALAHMLHHTLFMQCGHIITHTIHFNYGSQHQPILFEYRNISERTRDYIIDFFVCVCVCFCMCLYACSFWCLFTSLALLDRQQQTIWGWQSNACNSRDFSKCHWENVSHWVWRYLGVSWSCWRMKPLILRQVSESDGDWLRRWKDANLGPGPSWGIFETFKTFDSQSISLPWSTRGL